MWDGLLIVSYPDHHVRLPSFRQVHVRVWACKYITNCSCTDGHNVFNLCLNTSNLVFQFVLTILVITVTVLLLYINIIPDKQQYKWS